MKKTSSNRAIIGVTSLLSLFTLEAVAGEPAKPFVPVPDLVKIVEAREWSYLKLHWTTDEGDNVTEGPEIIIIRHDDRWYQLYRPIVRPVVKNERVDLTAEQVAEFTNRLGEFMTIAEHEIDFFESLRGLTEAEQQARKKQVMDESGAYGIGYFGYSLELRQGGQTLKTGDAFTETQTMLKWMRSQNPNGEQGGAGRPATSRESDSQGSDKPQPESKRPSR